MSRQEPDNRKDLTDYQRLERSRKLVKYEIDEEGAVTAKVARFDPDTGDSLEDQRFRIDLAQLRKQRDAHLAAIALLDEEIAAVEAVLEATKEKKIP
jgi:hypothetical protein